MVNGRGHVTQGECVLHGRLFEMAGVRGWGVEISAYA